MKIDWERRYRIMKNHTLSHFLFHGITETFRKNKVDLFLKGCSINEEKGGFSLNNDITDENFADIKNSVSSSFISAANVEMHPEPTNDEIFYWQCNGIIIPCGGTHVKNTSEIAEYEIRKKSGGKGKAKIFIYEKR